MRFLTLLSTLVYVAYAGTTMRNAFFGAVEEGNSRHVYMLLPVVDLNAQNGYALRKASELEHLAIISQIANEPRAEVNEAVEFAIQHGNEAQMRHLLDWVDWDAQRVASKRFLNLAIEGGHQNIVRLLLNHREVKPTNSLIEKAFNKGDAEILRMLLENPRSSLVPNVVRYYRSDMEAEKMVNVMKVIFSDSRTKLDYFFNPKTRQFQQGDNPQVVHDLFQWAVSTPNQERLAERLTFSYHEALEKNPALDPSMNHNAAIQYAAQTGNVGFVKLLLRDSRVNPADLDNKAYKLANLKRKEALDKLEHIFSDHAEVPKEKVNLISMAITKPFNDILDLLH